MNDRYPKAFWEWARENGLTPRGPRGSYQNRIRQKDIGRLRKEWGQMQKEKSSEQSSDRATNAVSSGIPG